ncbi:MAG TPA: LamG-like jellyroll fold domain-containing protein [Planctomycetota bacterium]|nr:LamG-like jellyroll fold domain-containing protein [Planctomycetota bacterium]
MRATRAGSSGVTLLELLTVLVIFSLLLGLTVAFMQGANRDLGVSAAANHAVAVLRVAHQESRSSAAPSWVVLDAKQGRIYLLSKETVGEWHLEDLVTTGAFGKDGKVNGGSLVIGRVGKGIQLSGSSTIAFGEVPTYTVDQGVSIEFWFLRRSSRGRGVLATIGDAVEIATETDGHIEAKVGSLRVSSGEIHVPQEAWCHLQVLYSGRELKLILNRREVQSVAGKTELPRGLAFAVGGSGFTGIVDEVRLGLIIPREEYFLPSECSITFKEGTLVPPSGEMVIGFDAEGRLDPSVSPQPFSFTIKSPAAQQEITVGPGGTLQR